MPADGFVCTNELRFVNRLVEEPIRGNEHLANARARHILQQLWVVAGTMFGDELNSENSEWRDVPLVDGE